ncbi:MAG: BREX-2 system adenine-specific DNA-methyltransferase PglX, partial [bacterium]
AYIPGHNGKGEGTTTAVLVGRRRPPLQPEIRVVMGIRSEPGRPADPSRGFVWRAIVLQTDSAKTESEWLSVRDIPRAHLAKHPWSLGGGGASELVRELQLTNRRKLKTLVSSVGFAAFSGEDEVFIRPRGVFERAGVAADYIRVLVKGEDIRDWIIGPESECLCLYDLKTHRPLPAPRGPVTRVLWPFRTHLMSTRGFGGRRKSQSGTPWWHWYRWLPQRLSAPLPLAYAYVATHAHVARGRANQVFRGGASVGVIKLRPESTDEDHHLLSAFLNSSVSCFLARQLFYPKGGFASGKWEERLEWDATKLREFPVPEGNCVELARRLDVCALSVSGVSLGVDW